MSESQRLSVPVDDTFAVCVTALRSLNLGGTVVPGSLVEVEDMPTGGGSRHLDGGGRVSGRAGHSNAALQT